LALPKDRKYCEMCGQEIDNNYPHSIYCSSCRKILGVPEKKKKYTGPSVAEVDREAAKLGLSYGALR